QLLPPHSLECLAVHEPNANTTIPFLPERELGGWIVLPSLRQTRNRVQHRILADFVGEVVAVDNVYPLRKLPSKRVLTAVDRPGFERVVIPWKQEHRSFRSTVLLQVRGKSLPPLFSRLSVVEQVTGAKNRIGFAVVCQLQDPFNNSKSLSRQLLFVILSK